jgi:cyanate permease
VLKSRLYWALALPFVGSFILYIGFMQSIRPFTADLGLAATQTATMLSLLHVVRLCGNAGFGYAADRVDHRLLFCIAGSALCIGIWTMTLSQSYAVLLGGAAILGIASGGLLPVIASLTAARFGVASFGRVSGLFSPLMAVTTVGAVLVGHLRDTMGSFEPAFRILVLLTAPLIFAVLLAGRARAPGAVAATAGKAA